MGYIAPNENLGLIPVCDVSISLPPSFQGFPVTSECVVQRFDYNKHRCGIFYVYPAWGSREILDLYVDVFNPIHFPPCLLTSNLPQPTRTCAAPVLRPFLLGFGLHSLLTADQALPVTCPRPRSYFSLPELSLVLYYSSHFFVEIPHLYTNLSIKTLSFLYL